MSPTSSQAAPARTGTVAARRCGVKFCAKSSRGDVQGQAKRAYLIAPEPAAPGVAVGATTAASLIIMAQRGNA